MIQQTETRFRFNEKKFFHSQKDRIINQLHLYNGTGYKRDKDRHESKREKSKGTVTRANLDFKLQEFCLILCNKQKKRKAFVRRETETLKRKYVIYFLLKWWRVNIKEDSRSTGNLFSGSFHWSCGLEIPALHPLNITFKWIPLNLLLWGKQVLARGVCLLTRCMNICPLGMDQKL